MTLDRHHIILYAAAAILALGVVYLVESRQADRAEQKYEILKAQSDVRDSANTQLQLDILKQVEALKSQNQQLQTQNQQQAQLVSNLASKLQGQKQVDAKLPPNELASRIQTLAPGGSVTVVPNGYTLDQSEAVAVTQALEEPPILKQQLAASQVVVNNDSTIIANDAKVLDAEKLSHVSDVGALQAQLDAANQEVKAVTAAARKGKLKWFGIGFVTGFVTGHFFHL